MPPAVPWERHCLRGGADRAFWGDGAAGGHRVPLDGSGRLAEAGRDAAGTARGSGFVDGFRGPGAIGRSKEPRRLRASQPSRSCPSCGRLVVLGLRLALFETRWHASLAATRSGNAKPRWGCRSVDRRPFLGRGDRTPPGGHLAAFLAGPRLSDYVWLDDGFHGVCLYPET